MYTQVILLVIGEKRVEVGNKKRKKGLLEPPASIVCCIAHLAFALRKLVGIGKKGNRGVYKWYRVFQIRMSILYLKDYVFFSWFGFKWNWNSKIGHLILEQDSRDSSP